MNFLSDGYSLLVKGHKSAVYSANFNPDGRFLVTSSEDKTVKLWNSADRKLRVSFEGHSKPVRCTDFHPSSRSIVSGSDDRSMRIWDIEHKQQVLGFLDHAEPITSVTFHPNSVYVASASMDKKIKIYDMRIKKLIQHYDAHSHAVNSISFHPSGDFLVSASDDSKLKVWDLRYKKLGFTLFGHTGAATCVKFSPQGDYIASGGDDTVVLVWKSNFSESPQEIIPELPSPSQALQTPKPKPTLTEQKRAASVAKANKLLITSPRMGLESMSFTKGSPNFSRRSSPSHTHTVHVRKFLQDVKDTSGIKYSEKEPHLFESQCEPPFEENFTSHVLAHEEVAYFFLSQLCNINFVKFRK